MARTTIRTEDVTDSEVTTAKMATDPTNASNLSSGSVPTAQLGNVNTSGLEDDIALLGFKVASNGSLAKYNLVDQTVDAFEDASGVDASASTNESRNADGYYTGASDATGGTITSYGSYTVHTFLASADFVASASGTADILVVAGGGSGGTNGGGGGAGGFRTVAATAVSAATHAVTVGAGGAGGAYDYAGTAGGTSSFGSILVASGGARGGTSDTPPTGGSGGGGGYQNDAGSAGNSGGYSPVEGYAGSASQSSGVNYGGGGGASEAGGTDGNGYGGDGATNLYQTGVNQTYAGGGGGGIQAVSGATGLGGDGGGGDGTTSASFDSGTAGSGTANTGGGGGGSGGGSATSGSGGSGIVVIRYTGSMGPALNMTLVSTTTAAQAAPTKGDIVLTYTNGAGTTTLDTDLTAEISADGGSTWTALALGSEGSTGSHNIATSHDITISSTITAPYNMAYRIKTLNQAADKTTRIQAVSLGWS
jgi:hypothetical protein